MKSAVKVVIDANVLVSALFGGTPAAAVRLAFDCEVWISPEIEAELVGVGRKLERKLSLRHYLRWNRTIYPLLRSFHRVEHIDHVRLSRDRNDDSYLGVAKTVAGNYLVTGDQDLLSISLDTLARHGLPMLAIVTPRQFLKRCC